MSEARLWSWLRDRLPRGHYTRIESEVGAGFPDVHFTMHRGISVTLELKYADGPKRTPLKGHIRKSQVDWILAEVEAGGKVWVVAELPFYGHRVLFLPGKHIHRLEECTPEFLEDLSDLMIHKNTDWGKARTMISGLLTRRKL